jgi:methyltransferase family protein
MTSKFVAKAYFGAKRIYGAAQRFMISTRKFAGGLLSVHTRGAMLDEIRILKNEMQSTRDSVRRLISLNMSQSRNGDPIDWYVTGSHFYFDQSHFHDHYIEWRIRRLRKIMEIFGTDFAGKRILEVGGGLGDMGAFFAAMGATVVSLEGRAVNQQFANLKYRNLPNFKSIVFDAEQDFTHLGRFDLILNLGFLEVVTEVDHVMDCCCRMSDHIFVETMVCDSLDPNKVILVDWLPGYIDHPLRGKGARPSPFYIERFFELRGYATRRAFDVDLNTYMHIYDWKHENHGTADNYRRFWYFSKGDAGGGAAAQ